jgi:citrate synthase
VTNPNLTRPGLREVIAGETRICKLDEQESKIYIFGYPMEELVERHSYEDVAHLILMGALPGDGYSFAAPNASALQGVWSTISTEPHSAHPMGLLRTAMSSLGNRLDDPNATPTLESDQRDALSLTPHVGYSVGLVGRHMKQQEAVLPDPGLGYAANILYMLRGSRPDPYEARALDISLILYTEHEFNAGSYAVRVAASTLSDLYSSMVAGECVLRGPRHGCANEESMKLMLEVGSPDRVASYLDRFFQTPGARLPGFGHAVYNLPHSHDPRVDVLRPWVRELSRRKGDMRWYEVAIALEEHMAERMKPRVAAGNPNAPANMDLWTAPLYYLLGIDIPLYTPIFAASRVAGWAAHYLELKYVNKEPIIRPRASYVGPEPHSFEETPHHGALDPKYA